MRAALVLGILLLAAPSALAHGSATLPGDSLARATPLVGPPARMYETLEADTPHYYRFAPDAGSVRLRVLAPDAAPAGLVLVVIFGPDLPHDTPVPAGVERPAEGGALVFAANADEPAPDARLPARHVALLDRALDLAAGEHVVVLLAEDAARLALVLEDEPSPVLDAFLMPTWRADARAWSGVPSWAALLVGALGMGVVGALATRAPRGHWSLLRLCAWVAAALVAASTATLLLDAARERIVPWLPLAASAATLGVALGVGWAATRAGLARRALLAVAAVVAFLGWAGFLWGPALALAGAVLPDPEKTPP